MKYSLKRVLCLMLATLILVCAAPFAFAQDAGEDGEYVVTSITRNDTGTVTVSSGSLDIVLTVPFSTPGSSINLSSGTDIGYNTGTYDTAVASFSEPAAIGGDAVTMSVSYKRKGDSGTYSTDYNVSVVRAAKKEATLSGNISKTVAVPGSASFAAADFSGKYTQNDSGALSAISIEGANPTFGALKLNGAPYNGAKIDISDISGLTFDATSAGTVDYIVSAYPSDNESSSISDTILLKITAQVVIPTANDIKYSVEVGSTVKLSLSDFTSAVTSKLGQTLTLDYIQFDSLGNSSIGTMYHGYTSSTNVGTAVTAGTKFYNSGQSNLISNITYVPKSAGSAVFGYKAYSTSGRYLTGEVVITSTTKTVPAISYSVDFNGAKKFDVSDFYNRYYNYSGRELSYVKFSNPSATYGTLYYNYVSSSNKGSTVSTGGQYYYSGTPALSTVAFVASRSGTTTLNYTAYDSTGTFPMQGTISISIGSASSGAVVEYETRSNQKITFTNAKFNNASKAVIDRTLSYIVIDDIPATSEGYLYYDYTSSSNYGTRLTSSSSHLSRKYYTTTSSSSGTYQISKLTFVPRSGFDGIVYIPFTGYYNTSTYFQGYIEIYVDDYGSGGDIIEYEVSQNDVVKFSASDFNSVCRDIYNSNLDNVRFTLPSSSYGTLYLNYSESSGTGTKVSSSTRYYRNKSPQISDITFVPRSSYEGTFTMRYTAWSVDSDEYDGEIEITVTEKDEGLVSYSVRNDETVTFKAADFNEVCNYETGETLSYIQFKSLPSTSRGKLYVNYTSASNPGTAVATNTKYYRTSTNPQISKITFVPSSSYTGTFNITYTGYDVYGEDYDGDIKITVRDEDSVEDEDVITYETTNTGKVTFNATDFNNVSRNINNATLDYVNFTIPSSTYGRLYLNYTSETSPGTAVSSATDYKRSGSPNISSVTFVPNTSYSGTFTLNYTGYDISGYPFSGIVKIKVTKGTDSAATSVSYKTDNKTPISMVANDFNTVCFNATASNLSYVRFTLPSSTAGTLYYNYSSSTGTGTAVTASTSYYAGSSPLLSAVTFVPNSSYTGSVTINYTGYSLLGYSYSGTVVITVSAPTSTTSVSKYFTDVPSSLSWASTAIDYLYEKSIVTGTSANVFSPGNNIKRGDFILMLHRAFKFTTSSSTTQFTDTPSTSYYAAAILAAKSSGIALGGGDNKFRPEESLTREDAMVLVLRTLEAANKTITKGTASDLSSFSDRNSVSSYATEAVASLVKAGYIQGSEGKINPKSNITRAEMSVLLHRILTK